jgi:hypothetical protein
MDGGKERGAERMGWEDGTLTARNIRLEVMRTTPHHRDKEKGLESGSSAVEGQKRGQWPA